jgi:hypothetical protein
MSEIVERAARACYEALGGADPQATPWPDLRERDKDGFRNQVRVTIDAIREPTEEMRRAFYLLDEARSPTSCIEGWQAMIDAALK